MAMGLSHAFETRYRRRSLPGRPLYEDESERISIMARSLGLHSRPNTLAQTNCHSSFYACNSAADHTSPVRAASSTGRRNTIQRIDSTMLARENQLFGCTRSKPGQGSFPDGLTLASDFGSCFQCQAGSGLVLHRPIEITALIRT
jgi:hypothetical protein